MLSLGSFSKQSQCCAISYTPISHLLPSISKNPQKKLFFHSIRETHVSIPSLLWKIRTGFRICAVKGQEKNAKDVLEMEGFDDDDEDGEDDDDDFVVYEDEDDVDGDEDDDDELIVPLENMKKWLEQKPRGFGEGKEYDTSVEDKLMEEIEQSRTAQLANINKLKHNPVKPVPKEKVKQVLQDKNVQDGTRVRLVNLPKKRNIDKDLNAAFKGVPGIANIVPAVSGNKKTRDPICTGLAFIDFKSEDQANKFVQTFSGRSITFGKVQKQIKCEMTNFKSATPARPKPVDILKKIESADEISYAPEQAMPDLHGDVDDEFDTDLLSSDSEEKISTDRDVAEIKNLSAHTNDSVENAETFSAEFTSNDEQDVREVSYIAEQQKKVQGNEKKKKPKRKKETVSGLNIPGSARRLKTKEKAVLTGVLSKYAQKTALAMKEQS